MEKKNIIIIIAIILVVGGASFFGGLQIGKSQTKPNSNFPDGFTQGNLNNKQGNNGIEKRNVMGGGMISGQILSIDEGSITLKLKDGGSKIINILDSTKIEKTIDSTKDELTKDINISVIGKTNNNGTVDAMTIQITPILN